MARTLTQAGWARKGGNTGGVGHRILNRSFRAGPVMLTCRQRASLPWPPLPWPLLPWPPLPWHLLTRLREKRGGS